VALEQNLFIVSDGMGGHQAGEVASRAVVTVLPRMLEQQLASVNLTSSSKIEAILRETILELSQRLRDESSEQVVLKGMGATVALALLRGSFAYLAHMGDSRIYLFRQGNLTQLTEDHSIIALLLKNGAITPVEAQEHPAIGKLSRYVGMEGEVYPDVQTLSLQSGDRLLLCSDGLTSMVSDAQIAKLLQFYTETELACRGLVDTANAAGGKDNITVVVVNCGDLLTS
jgi:protein phosphatase